MVIYHESGGCAFPSDRSFGMTLRDYFAAKAMQGLLSNRNAEAAIDEFAAKSYRMADAMLKAREQ
jgi:hypothetical protein